MTTETSHAKRAILQTTLSPIHVDPKHGKGDRPLHTPRPAIERSAPIRRFRPTGSEIAAARDRVQDADQQAILDAAATEDAVTLIATVNRHDGPL